MKLMMKYGLLVMLAAAVLLLTGCTALQARLEGVPVWTIEKPSNNLTKVFFVGEGHSNVLNETTARELAYEDILSGVSDFLGFDVGETYRRELIQTQMISEIELEITDEFVKERDGRLTLFVLAEATRGGITPKVRSGVSDNRAEESRISGPENEAVNAYRKQEDFRAFSLYIEAALEAYRSSLANGRQRYDQLMDRAVEILEGMQLVKTKSDVSAGVFSAQVTRGTGLFAPELGGVPVRVVFPVHNQIGITRQETLRARTNSRGAVSFRPKPTIFRGSGTLMMYLDITDELAMLTETVGAIDRHVVELRSIITEKRLEYEYAVVSQSAGTSVVTAMLEYDRNGTLLIDAKALESFNASLTNAGFSAESIRPDLQLDTETRLLERIRAVYPQGISMALIGSVGISSITSLETSHIVLVRGSVKAYRINDRSLYTDSGELAVSGSGGSIEQARGAAFNKFGQIAASVIAGKLL
jgi:hypothetical protein